MKLCLADVIKTGRQSNLYRPDPFIIAEIGVNHENNMDLAKTLIEQAALGGASAAKFQTYRAKTLASKDSPAYWDTSQETISNQRELFSKYDKFWKNEYETLKIACESLDIEFLSTPFDIESANFLNDLVDSFKISSSDITNRPFIEYLCRFDKPILLSTGASDLREIERAVSWVQHCGNPLALMHCVLNYPTAFENANLAMINGLQENFPDLVVGYSDHTLPGDMKVLELAWVLGAQIIEKHFTHDKGLQGNDHYHSMDASDLKVFWSRLAQCKDLLGSKEVDYLPSEELARRNARRSLVLARDVGKGAVIKAADLTWKRPAYGISPEHLGDVIGKTATRDLCSDEILYREMFD